MRKISKQQMLRLGERQVRNQKFPTLEEKLAMPEQPLVRFDNHEIFRGRAVLRIDFMLRNIR